MNSTNVPVPTNEMNRLLDLYQFDIDYSSLKNSFKDLTHLAAKISGADISLVNLIDSYTQWSVSNVGLDIDQMPREDSVCQYTILEDDHFEVQDLSTDIRFKDKAYVNSPLNLRYYFGIPLKTNAGQHIGALCVLDKNEKKLSEEKIEFLKIIAKEIISKLNSLKIVDDLKTEVLEIKESSKKVAHDIRGPISGIIGLTAIIKDETKETETLALADMISKSGNSVLELADEILKPDSKTFHFSNDTLTLFALKQKLEKLYNPQAKAKEIVFNVIIKSNREKDAFKKDKLLQIIGNLISNAIKFTANYGEVKVYLDIQSIEDKNNLIIEVVDNGLGLNQHSIDLILEGKKPTSSGTKGEIGYGYGLTMVRNLIKSIHGNFNIKSELTKGTKFEVYVPI